MRILLLAAIAAFITPALASDHGPTWDELVAENAALKAKLTTCEAANDTTSTCRPFTAQVQGEVPDGFLGVVATLEDMQPYLLDCLTKKTERMDVTMVIASGHVVELSALYSPRDIASTPTPGCVDGLLRTQRFMATKTPVTIVMQYSKPSESCAK